MVQGGAVRWCGVERCALSAAVPWEAWWTGATVGAYEADQRKSAMPCLNRSALLPRLKLVGMPAMSQRAAVVVGMGDRRVDGVGVSV